MTGILNSILDLAKWDAGAFPVKKQVPPAPLLPSRRQLLGESKGEILRSPLARHCETFLINRRSRRMPLF